MTISIFHRLRRLEARVMLQAHKGDTPYLIEDFREISKAVHYGEAQKEKNTKEAVQKAHAEVHS